MINDINIGVFFPGLLMTVLIALICTLSLLLIFSFSRLYRRLPFRPLIDFSTFIISCFLLLQGLTTLELFA